MNPDRFLIGIGFLGLSLIVGQPGLGQSTPVVNSMPSHDIKFELDSGAWYHLGDQPKVIWTETISVPGAHWLRLHFSHLVLAGSPLGGQSSILRITGLEDGKFQLLDAVTARQWGNTSACFNGNSLRLELIAVPNGRMNLVRIAKLTVGEANSPNPAESICDVNDDRVLSSDPRVGRTIPGGCTIWLFDDHNNCLLTAGHCANSTSIASFNVPLSDSSGNYQFPGPEDQYAIDPESRQFVNGGVGNDWCYVGCFPNSTTGLSAFETQGDSFELAAPDAVQKGDLIRITGHGSTSFPVNPSWNGAQKTQVGAYALFAIFELGYRTDTTGGNSGSPVIFEATGQAIGIHTHGGCGSSGAGINHGTASINPGLTDALANPLGVCRTSAEFEFPNGLPETIDPAGGDAVAMLIDDSDIEIDVNSAILHVDTGPGFVEFPMDHLGGNQFEGEFPPTVCGTTVNYYFSIEALDGELFSSPAGAPLETNSVLSAAAIAEIPFADNFQTDMNWEVDGNAVTGIWQRGIPAGGGDRGDPPTDADGSGACYVTGNIDGDNDLDGGSTTLTSPVMDGSLASGQELILSYYRWFNNGGEGDIFLIEISNNAGASWSALETIGPGGPNTIGGWKLVIFNVADFVDPTDQLRVRFTASDLDDTSIVEAGVDGVTLRLVECDSTGVIPGDVNGDGVVNLLDVQPFVDVLTSGGFNPAADVNMDGVVNLLDIAPFVLLLIAP